MREAAQIQGLSWSPILEQVSHDPDLESLIIDATIIRAHQHAAGGNVWPAPSASSFCEVI